MTSKRRAPPLAREELLKGMVTDADSFTALRYLRAREETPALWDLEQSGQATLPGVTAALGDVYHSLWSEGVALKDKDQVPASRQYWRGLLETTLPTAAFQELHAKTCGDRLLSTLGTVEAGRTILHLVPAEDAEKLEEVAKAQAEADNLEQEAGQAQADADVLQELAKQMMQAQQGDGEGAGQGQAGGNADGQPQGSPSSGAQGAGQSQPGQKGGPPQGGSSGSSGGLSPAQAQALANRLAQAQAKAKEAMELADLAKAEAQAKAEALMGQPGSVQAEAKLRELARLGQAALQASSEKVQEVAETISGWGLDKGELHSMEVPEALGLVERMRKNSAFKKLASLLGRLRAMAAKKARSKTEGEGRRVPRNETGRDISRAHTSELVSLTHQATRTKALIRWSRGELRLHGTETKRTLGRGPVIVCEDGSGSMDGAKQQWAKGVSLALAHFAKLQKRSFSWILFDTYVVKSMVRQKGALSAKDMLDIAESRSGGGTSFEAPLRRALETIRTTGLKKADVVFVTDGECAVSQAFLTEFLAAKKALEFTVVTILCDVGESADPTVAKFSERVEHASTFSAEEADAKVFNNL